MANDELQHEKASKYDLIKQVAYAIVSQSKNKSKSTMVEATKHASSHLLLPIVNTTVFWSELSMNIYESKSLCPFCSEFPGTSQCALPSLGSANQPRPFGGGHWHPRSTGTARHRSPGLRAASPRIAASRDRAPKSWPGVGLGKAPGESMWSISELINWAK